MNKIERTPTAYSMLKKLHRNQSASSTLGYRASQDRAIEAFLPKFFELGIAMESLHSAVDKLGTNPAHNDYKFEINLLNSISNTINTLNYFFDDKSQAYKFIVALKSVLKNDDPILKKRKDLVVEWNRKLDTNSVLGGVSLNDIRKKFLSHVDSPDAYVNFIINFIEEKSLDYTLQTLAVSKGVIGICQSLISHCESLNIVQNKKAILFDWDGTIAKTLEVWSGVFEETFKEFRS
jgi:hypothetical protein